MGARQETIVNFQVRAVGHILLASREIKMRIMDKNIQGSSMKNMTRNRSFRRQTRRSAYLFFAGICVFALASFFAQGSHLIAEAQETKNPLAGDPKTIQEGASQFRIDCALCHGLNARGGSRGPDLTRGVWTHGGSDAEIFHTITVGIPGTLMPANDLSDTEVWEIIAYLRSLTPQKPGESGGDRKVGEKIFFSEGNCSLCHMVDGKGGRLGPDLSSVGSRRSPEFLAEKLREPNKNLAPTMMDPGKEWPYDAEAVTVVTQDGQKVRGVIRNEDTFSIQLMDIEENLHMYLKKELREVIHEQKTLMPAYEEDLLDNQQLRDLVAYLDNLRGASSEEKR
jgi:cytochrome c oxidase cbb3-type subunit III